MIHGIDGGAWACRRVLHGERLEKLGAASAGHPSFCIHHFWIWLLLGSLDSLILVLQAYYCNSGMGMWMLVDVGGLAAPML
jgi:hypothetical protein